MYSTEEHNKYNYILIKSRNNYTNLNNNNGVIKQIQTYKTNTMKSSISSGEIDIDKQNNSSIKKLFNPNYSHNSLPKLTKSNMHYISLNKKLTNDLNYQINTTNKKIFGNFFSYKQTINLQKINDFMIYEKTKKSIDEHKKTGEKNSFDFRIPLSYKRMDFHYKKEDLIPFKTKPKINLMDVLYLHNQVLRKSMSQKYCRKYYLKNNLKLMKGKIKIKLTKKNIASSTKNKK